MMRLALTQDSAECIKSHLFSNQPLEQGAFMLVNKGTGRNDTRLTVSDVFLPSADTWEMQSEYNLRPSAQWISAAISRALTDKAGLLFVHSHPDERFPVGFIDRIVSVGRTLSFLSKPPPLEGNALDDRQIDALGIVHNALRSLTAAVVGCGGLGSPIAEQLVRMGVREIIIIDNDLLDTPSNVRRVFGSRSRDLKAKPYRYKVEIVGNHLRQLGLGAKVRSIIGDVRTEEVFRHLVDADVVLVATDTHSSRAVVNELPSRYFLPVIDTGVRIGNKGDNKLSNLVAEVRILTPSTPCLWCRKSINSDVIRCENLPSNERDQLSREGYVVQGIGEPAPSVIALTVLGSGLASCALLGLLSEEGSVAANGYWIDGLFGYSGEVGPEQPRPDCRCRRKMGYGDDEGPPFITGEPS
jgi:molybdopterin/thiamine biosynthesis adenylyltransferase